MKADTGGTTTADGPAKLSFGPILAVLYMLGFTNLFLRTGFGVMSPDLARELELAPATLSLVGSVCWTA